MGKFESWMDELAKGMTPFFKSVNIIAHDVYNTIRKSPQAQAMRDTIKSGKMKIEEATRYIIDMQKVAHVDPMMNDSVIWEAMEEIVKNDFANYDDAFFEQLASLKDNPQIAKIARKILEDRQSKHPKIIFDNDVEAIFVKFTDRAKHVVCLAEIVARKMGHNFIAAPHLMIGIMREGSGVGSHVMKELKGNYDKLYEATKINMSDIEEAKPGEPIRLTKRAREVLLRADKERQDLNFDRIGTEHILLSLASEFERNGPLQATGVKAEDIRSEVLRLIGPQTSSTLTVDDIKAISESIVRVEKGEFINRVVVGDNKVIMSQLPGEAAQQMVDLLRSEIEIGVVKHLKAKGLFNG